MLPASYLSNGLITKPVYTSSLAKEKGQFLPDGMMPATGPTTARAIDKLGRQRGARAPR